jgi:hypothetical protein
MINILSAVALVVAAPAAGHTPPAADPHAAHRQGDPQHKDHEQHKECCKMQCCKKMKEASKDGKGCCPESKAPSDPQKQHKGH